MNPSWPCYAGRQWWVAGNSGLLMPVGGWRGGGWLAVVGDRQCWPTGSGLVAWPSVLRILLHRMGMFFNVNSQFQVIPTEDGPYFVSSQVIQDVQSYILLSRPLFWGPSRS